MEPKAPDRLGYIIAIRAWSLLKPGFLQSGEWFWTPGEPLRFECSSAPKEHQTEPMMECTCGIYAISNVIKANEHHLGTYGLIGEVALWGSVIVHEHGYRAEYAYPLSIGTKHSKLYGGRLEKVAKLYNVKLLTLKEVQELVKKYTPPPPPLVCPLCHEAHFLKDCQAPEKEAILRRALRDIEYRRNYNLKKRGKL